MNPIKTVFSPTIKEYIRQLPPLIKKPLRKIIDEIKITPLCGKLLQEELTGYRSKRYHKYRVIYYYDEDNHLVHILYAGLRHDVYRLFSEYLKRNKKT